MHLPSSSGDDQSATPVLDHFYARAAEVADVADVVTTEGRPGQVVHRLVPRRRDALTVAVIAFRGEDAHWSFQDDPYGRSGELYPPVSEMLEEIDDLIDEAVEGRVRSLHGPSRGDLVTTHRDGSEWTLRLTVGLGGLVPRRGWRKTATLVDYVPYRD